jgi:Xaa-Pro aminopeptidase
VFGDADAEVFADAAGERLVYRLWSEHVDLRPQQQGEVRTRIAAARPDVLRRPAQFDPVEVATNLAAAVRAVAPNPRRVGADLAAVPAADLERLQQALPGVELVDASATFANQRAIKDADEIAQLRLACELTEAGIAGAIARLVPGMTEVAVNAAYQVAAWERAAADTRFAALRQVEGVAAVGIGASPASRMVAPGQTVKFDMQVDVGGYHSDVGRTVALAPTVEQQEVYAALRAALAAAESAVRPGVPIRDVYETGVAAMRSAGFETYSRGHLGHSIGLAHCYEEPPFIAADEARPLTPGMVLSLELPYYLYGVGAFQLERMLLVTADGHETMDQLPFELALH